jgi:hypothetical protein
MSGDQMVSQRDFSQLYFSELIFLSASRGERRRFTEVDDARIFVLPVTVSAGFECFFVGERYRMYGGKQVGSIQYFWCN